MLEKSEGEGTVIWMRMAPSISCRDGRAGAMERRVNTKISDHGPFLFFSFLYLHGYGVCLYRNLGSEGERVCINIRSFPSTDGCKSSSMSSDDVD
jgi:hypothetical protein